MRAVPGAPGVFAIEAARLQAAAMLVLTQRTEAATAWQRAGEEALRIGWWAAADESFEQATAICFADRALEPLARALRGTRDLLEVRGDAYGTAAAEQNLGSVAHWRGDLPAALRHYGEARIRFEMLERPEDAMQVRSLRSMVLADVGDLHAALEEQAALAVHFEGRPHDEAWIDHLQHRGHVLYRLGDGEGAEASYAQALEGARALDDRTGMVVALGNIALARLRTRGWEASLGPTRQALEGALAVEDATLVTAAYNNLADVLRLAAVAALQEAERAEEPASRAAARTRARTLLREAESHVEEAMRGAEQTGAEGQMWQVAYTQCQILQASGRLEKTRALLERVRHEAARARSWQLEVSATSLLARTLLMLRDYPGALGAARSAAAELLCSFGGLPEMDIARVREHLADVFDLGANAAFRAERSEDFAWFLEAGRAMALLRGLGGRAAAMQALVPPDLQARADAALAAKVAAYRAWQRPGLERSRRLAAWKTYEERRTAEDELRAEIERVQASAVERLVPERLLSLYDLQARLQATTEPGLRQAFVTFSFHGWGGYALIVHERSVDAFTYTAEEVRALGEAFTALAAARSGSLDPEALAVVKRVLVGRLGLPATGRTRLFVCPDGALGHVPLSVVLPDDWELVWEPSATTYALLANRGLRRGRGVLAIGDPDYGRTARPDALASRGGPRLVPLPGTRDEVEAIADRPSDRRLLGAEATEARLVATLAQAGPTHVWQSVHFACHGLVDVERPALSCLALTPAGEDDGFLTAREILQLRMPTDLAVLSACQTGRGRFIVGEGLVGLTRAFMYAGAPRVLVSLWNVDDEATAYLMKHFYAGWRRDGLPAATALRRAQLAVRDHEVTVPSRAPGEPAGTERPWADPAYWGAWSLWGLPD